MSKQPKTPITQFQKCIDAEQYVTWATNDVLKWTSDERVRDALKRAQYLLAEVRHAAMTLEDPATDVHAENEALYRLDNAIRNCE